MIKLIALDLDGTVVSDGLTISDKLQRTLNYLNRETDIRVVIATGRMFPSTINFARTLGCDGPLICYQGGMIRDLGAHGVPAGADAHAYPVLYHQPIDFDVARDIARLVQDNGFHTNFYINDVLHTTHFNPESEYYAKITGVTPIHSPVPEAILDAPPTKIMIIDEGCDDIIDQIKASHGQHVSLCKSRHNFCEIVHAEVSKWNALAQLMADWHLPAEAVMAVGDQENDLSMIRAAGLGVAMGNAPDHVKAEADFVTSDIQSEGVIAAIEQHVFGGTLPAGAVA
ncbi:MAG: HAD family phosphatase [Cyanobacteria bacterium HKST-UBA04]|nr:HAD family phosphatase [Cyanobacteria bacterium HKST-UBA04]